MKGLDDLIVGLLLTVVSVVVILKFRNVALNIGLFIVLLLGSYGMIRGILEILYSLKLQRRKSNNVKIEIMKIVVAVTEFISLIVVILQLVKELVQINKLICIYNLSRIYYEDAEYINTDDIVLLERFYFK